VTEIVSYPSLQSTLRVSVCELFIKRRNFIKGRPSWRRMLCTNSVALLNSVRGKTQLLYRPPKGLPPFNPYSYNLIITWDIMVMDYRCINMDLCFLVGKYPVVTDKNQETFWGVFDEYYLQMTSKQKQQFLDS
jgi:hypothetical protein